MSLLQVMPDDDRANVLLRTEDVAEIAAALAPHGIRFERLATVQLDPAADQEAVLAAYESDVRRVSEEGPYPIIDVFKMRPDDDDPEWPARAAAARGKFLDEHTHDEDEVRIFVEGTGCFYLHLDNKVFAMVCTAGDLMSVPAGTTHWFDLGARPTVCAIRFFQEEDGWVGGFTGSTISSQFPTLEELLEPVPAS
jgi:1,2-dihydroxy-3-keto-5-methylthiopentene dioxygenase